MDVTDEVTDTDRRTAAQWLRDEMSYSGGRVPAASAAKEAGVERAFPALGILHACRIAEDQTLGPHDLSAPVNEWPVSANDTAWQTAYEAAARAIATSQLWL